MKKSFRILAVILAATMLLCCCSMAYDNDSRMPNINRANSVTWYIHGVMATGSVFCGSSSASGETTYEGLPTYMTLDVTFRYYVSGVSGLQSNSDSIQNTTNALHLDVYPKSEHTSGITKVSASGDHYVTGSTTTYHTYD